MGRFISVSIEGSQLEGGKARAIQQACPVDIFTVTEVDELAVVAENKDECILCGRCVGLAPGAVTVTRRYGSEKALAPAGESGV